MFWDVKFFLCLAKFEGIRAFAFMVEFVVIILSFLVDVCVCFCCVGLRWLLYFLIVEVKEMIIVKFVFVCCDCGFCRV